MDLDIGRDNPCLLNIHLQSCGTPKGNPYAPSMKEMKTLRAKK